MSICYDNHRAVCYDSRWCPVCEKMKDIQNLEEQVVALKDEIQELKQAEKL